MNLTKYVTENKIILAQDKIRLLFNNLEENKNTIVKSQLPLALYLASSFSKTTKHHLEDLFAEALIAISESILKYDNTSKASFTTFCKQNIIWKLNSFDNDLIRIPRNRIKNDDNPKAKLFSNYLNDDNNNYFEETIADDSTLKIDIEQNLINLIKENLKKEYWADIVIKNMGLGMNKRMNCREIGEYYNKNKEGIRQIYETSLKKLQNNDEFKFKLKELYQLN